MVPVSGLLLALALAGCAGGYDTQTAVRNAVDEFHDGFHWGAMGSMISHIRPADQDAFMADYEARMEGVTIADYEVNRLQIADDKSSAQVWVGLSWFRNDEMVVHDVVVRETWVEEGSTWVRTEVAVERGELP